LDSASNHPDNPCLFVQRAAGDIDMSEPTASQLLAESAIPFDEACLKVIALEKQRDELLDAAKYSVSRLAEFNAGGTIETAQHMKTAQKMLFDAVKNADPGYYGIKQEAT
jgi:hypothetical protein